MKEIKFEDFEKLKEQFENYKKLSIPDINKLDSIKGDNGSIATIGGSLEFTGAPYYGAITGLKAGNDLSHVFCQTDAAIPIKSYSPELIVHPGIEKFKDNEYFNKEVIHWFKHMDSVLIGPGLGKREETIDNFNQIYKYISKTTIPLVLDADSTWYWTKLLNNNEIENNGKLILTPNYYEFNRICKDLLKKEFNEDILSEQRKLLSEIYKNNNDFLIKINPDKNFLDKYFVNEMNLYKKYNCQFILVKKGICDIVTNGKEIYIVNNKGSVKRTGGIGDILAGLINCFCAITYRKQKGNVSQEMLIFCCIIGCFICREITRKTYLDKKFTMTALDIIESHHFFDTIDKFYSN